MRSQEKSDEVVSCAIVTSLMTPSMAHLQRRVTESTTDLDLQLILTVESGTLPWKDGGAAGKVVRFPLAAKQGERAPLHRQLKVLFEVLDYISHSGIRAVVVGGYNDLLRLGLIFLLPRRRVPVLLYADSNDLLEAHKPAWLRILKRLLLTAIQGRLEGILVMGESGRDYFQRYMASPPAIYSVPLVVDTDLYGGRSQYDYQSATARFSLERSRKRLLFVGRLTGVKGLDTLLDAFARMAQQRQEWDLVVAGIGEEEESLRRSVPFEIEERVKWTGFVDRDSLPSLYAACHVFVLPSRSDRWGVVVVEALASGLPVIGTDVTGAVAEIVTRFGGGVIVPAGDAEALTQALLTTTMPGNVERGANEASHAFRVWSEANDPVSSFRSAIHDAMAGQ